jgi:hypothetical protein
MAGMNSAVSRGAGSGKADARQRLAEALRINLTRRKAQKRDRAIQAEMAPAHEEMAECKTTLGLLVQNGDKSGNE